MTDTQTRTPRAVEPPPPGGQARSRRRSWLRRHRLLTALLVLLLLLTPAGWSLGRALTDPALGLSASARLAEWARDHGGASLVSWAENTWYSHHAPPAGGRPPAGEIPNTPSAPTAPPPFRSALRPSGHLPVPGPITPPASPALPDEGDWHPEGRLVHGVPALYEAFLRPDATHTSLVAGVAWMDTKLLRARLDGGSYIPGDGPWHDSAPITGDSSRTLVAAFNSGFRMKDAHGGYYSEGRTAVPLVDGQASVVIRDDGSITVEAWHGRVGPGSGIASVRQNLGLLVDNGAPVPGLAAQANSAWGGTVGYKVYVWRSGLGVTSNGALVYVAGPGLDVASLADLLVRAGAVRGMELDINTDWVNFASYRPATPDGPAAPDNGRDLLNTMSDTPARYFKSSWQRDFLTMSERP